MQMSNHILRADSTQPSLICRTAKYLAGVLAGVGLTLGGASGILAQADDEITPAPPSIGADVPVTYFGPTPSSVQRELVGPFQNLKAGKVDLDRGTITLPLYEGAVKSGQVFWYIVTDTDDKGNAE